MVRITRVYTKKGDAGETKVAANAKLSKRSFRVRALGDIDELNTFLGFALQSFDKQFPEVQKKIKRIQQELFDLGAMLSVPPEKKRADTPKITPTDVKKLEKEIDATNKKLTSLSSFVLPGGNEIAARLHLARTVCRRTERSLVDLSHEQNLEGVELSYLNRLSDWLFVQSRHIVKESGTEESVWNPKRKK